MRALLFAIVSWGLVGLLGICLGLMTLNLLRIATG
jgi:hypothetical protein